MAFIEKKDPIVLNIKLTSKGRELLSQGLLDFTYFAMGDSEMDYNFNAAVEAVDSEYSAFDASILRPADKNPSLLSFIPRNLTGDPYNFMPSVPVNAYTVENQVEPIGFFTSGGTTIITDPNHIKQPDAMVQINGVSGGFNLTLLKAPTYGTSGAEPQAGDLLYIKWTYDNDTTGYNVNKNYPTPNLFYKIVGINSGSLGSGNVQVSLDRPLPDFSGMGIAPTVYAGAMILYNQLTYSGETIINMTPTEYLDESVLAFLENSQCPTVIFPFWNMTIIHTEEIAGVQAANLKYTQFKNRVYGGFVSYIQNQAPIYKRLGVIHYTNSSPANVYAEGFLQKTPILEMPTIMWHKSIGTTLGATFIPYGTQKILTGEEKSLNTTYYDLVDKNDPSVVVGKVFNELKMFVIEDQELLFAMSYKSNRSWTLPDYTASTQEIPPCIIPTGISVTWLQPTTPTPPTSFAVLCTEYCHSMTPTWIPFTGSLSLIGVEDTGYRVTACKFVLEVDKIDTCICAVDIVTGVKFAGQRCIASTSDTYVTTTTLSVTCNPNSYYYKGRIDGD